MAGILHTLVISHGPDLIALIVHGFNGGHIRLRYGSYDHLAAVLNPQHGKKLLPQLTGLEPEGFQRIFGSVQVFLRFLQLGLGGGTGCLLSPHGLKGGL